MGNRTPIMVPFGAGMNQKTDPRALLPGQWQSIVNGQMNKNGALTMRSGFLGFSRTINTGGTLSGPIRRLAITDTELLAVDNLMGLYTAQSGSAVWTSIGQLPEATAARVTVSDSAQSQQSPDICVSGKYTIYTWVTKLTGSFPTLSGDLYAAIYDTTTGAVISPPTLILAAVAASPRVQVVGTTAMICFFDGTTLEQAHLTLSTNPGAWVRGGLALPDTPKTGLFDFIALSDRFVVAMQDSVGTKLQFATIDTAGGTIAHSTVFDANLTSLFCIGLGSFGSTIYCAYTGYNGVATATGATISLTNALGVNWGPIQLPAGIQFGPAGIPTQIAIVAIDATHGIVTQYSGSTVANTGHYAVGVTLSNGSAIGSVVFTPIAAPLSRPFTIGGITTVFELVFWGGTSTSGTLSLQGTLFLVAVGDSTGAFQMRDVATIAPRLAPPSVNGAQRMASSLANVSNAASLGSLVFQTLAAVVTDGQYPAGRVALVQTTFTFGNPYAYQKTAALEDVCFSGGVPSVYDGQRVFEWGFATYPELSASSFDATAAGAMGVGTYGYQVLYEYIDARGLRHWSAPSPAVLVPVLASKQVAITVPCLQLTRRNQAGGIVGIVVFRTLAGGATYYRLTPDEIPTANVNAQGTTTITIHDNTPDASLSTSTLLYTTGGELPNMCPPSASLSISHKGRIFLAGTDEGRTLWVSKYLRQGFAPGFHETLNVYFGNGGAITALASLDDKLIVFKSDRIFVMFGDGPPDTGAGSDFQIQTIVTDVGCSNPNSVVVMPDGIMFLAAKGICLLDRGLNVSYVGAPVEDIISAALSCDAAMVVPSLNQVRFGITILGDKQWVVYDYLQKQWVQWIVADSTGGQNTSINGGVVWNGLAYHGGSSGMVYKEAPSVNFDGLVSFPIVMTATSAHIKTTGIAGFQRIRRASLVGNNMANAAYAVSVTTDYGAAVNSYTWPANVAQIEVWPIVQKCEAMRFQVQVQSTAANAGYVPPALEGIELEVIADPRTFRHMTQGVKR